jgi:glycosyltransferase involved in cell wall biosynthesis
LDRRKVHFVAVSDGAAEYASHAQPWIAGRISTIRNGIDLSRFLQVPNGARRADHDEPVVLGAVGRLTPEKGYDCLLRAAAALRARGLRFVLRIAGTGSSLPACKELVRALDIGESVRFEGHVEDMAAFYRDIDLLVLPSPGREGLPRCIMEVLASGKPAIATRVPGNIEALEDRRQGLLVPPGDPQALAEAMERLARDPDLRLAMGNAGRARACELFDVNRVAREVKTLYRQLIGCRVATETKGDLPPFVVHGDFPRIARVAYGQEDERRRLR